MMKIIFILCLRNRILTKNFHSLNNGKVLLKKWSLNNRCMIRFWRFWTSLTETGSINRSRLSKTKLLVSFHQILHQEVYNKWNFGDRKFNYNNISTGSFGRWLSTFSTFESSKIFVRLLMSHILIQISGWEDLSGKVFILGLFHKQKVGPLRMRY